MVLMHINNNLAFLYAIYLSQNAYKKAKLGIESPKWTKLFFPFTDLIICNYNAYLRSTLRWFCHQDYSSLNNFPITTSISSVTSNYTFCFKTVDMFLDGTLRYAYSFGECFSCYARLVFYKLKNVLNSFADFFLTTLWPLFWLPLWPPSDHHIWVLYQKDKDVAVFSFPLISTLREFH